MASTINFWSPDTCPCQIHYEWDTTSDPATRVYTYKTLGQAQAIADEITNREGRARRIQPDSVLCPAHAALGNTEAMYDAVRGENARKNLTIGIIQAAKTDLDEEADIKWSFDVDRALHFQVRSGLLFPAQITSTKSALDIQFGPGKVFLEEF